MFQRVISIACVAAASLVLGACGSAVNLQEVPVETRTPTPGGAGAQAPAAPSQPQSAVATVRALRFKSRVLISGSRSGPTRRQWTRDLMWCARLTGHCNRGSHCSNRPASKSPAMPAHPLITLAPWSRT